jgi:hypothetical protein
MHELFEKCRVRAASFDNALPRHRLDGGATRLSFQIGQMKGML